MYVEKIKKACNEQNISIRELSEKIGMSFSGLYAALNNDTLKVNTLLKIGKELQLSVNDFFGDQKTINLLTNNSFLDYYEFDLIIVLSNRYSKFTEKISFFKDYFIWFTIKEIANGYKVKYPRSIKDAHCTLITNDKLKKLKGLIPKIQNIPFSKWDTEDAKLVSESWILFGFYFPIFEKNFMNIMEYLEDDMIKDKEILKFWKVWKQVQESL
jgi:transcriptional regulator with XRE-family HTH domain